MSSTWTTARNLHNCQVAFKLERNISGASEPPTGSLTMALQIVLDDSKQLGILHCYGPGQFVTGRVIYTPNQAQENIEDVSVHFEGRGNTKCDQTNYGDGFIDGLNTEDLLFCQEKQLFQGPFTVTQQNFTWPFQFVFPRHRSTQANTRLLPPSFDQSFPTRAGRCPDFVVLIRYELRAVVKYSSAVKSRALSCVQVAFRTLATDPTPKPQTQECGLKPATTHLHLQKLNPFHSKKSSVNFQIVALLPKILAPSLTQSLSLSIQNSTDSEKTNFYLTHVELILQSNTKSVHGSHVTRKEGTFSLNDLNLHLPSTGEDICLSANFGLGSIPTSPYLTPDFNNSNPYIDHTHIIKVQAKVMDKESNHSHDLEGDCPVTVLPPQQPKN